MSARIVLVRHGQTEWSEAGRHTGRTDVPLLPRGREAARILGGRLREAPWDGLADAVVRTSPLARARETCDLAGFGGTATEWDLLQEYDYGAEEGLTSPEIRARRGDDWDIWRDGVTDGETLAQLADRAERITSWARESEGDVLLFAHGHLLRAVAAAWLGQPVSFAGRLPLAPTSLSVLGYAHRLTALTRWNDTTHLD